MGKLIDDLYSERLRRIEMLYEQGKKVRDPRYKIILDEKDQLQVALTEKDAEIARLNASYDADIKAWVRKIEQLQADLDRVSSENKELRAKLNGYTTFLVKRGPYNMLALRDASTPIVVPETTTLQDILDDLDRVIERGVRFAQWLDGVDTYSKELDDDVENFLASPIVQSWRARQGKEAT